MSKIRQIFLLSVLITSVTFSRQQSLVVTFQRTGSRSAAKEYLNGYDRTISGAVIEYRSSHPDAQSALLVRARREVRSAAWETEPLRPPTDGVYHLVWLAGMEREGFKDDPDSYPFDLYVNGARWFTFRNRKDQTAWHWAETSANGARLIFQASMADRVGDMFGMMYLEIPAAAAPSGKPLSLEVIGADARSEDWYMTFQYSFKFAPSVRIEPVLLCDRSLNRLARLSIDNLVDSAQAEVSLPGGEVKRLKLNIGSNVLRVPFQGNPGSGKLTLVVRDRPSVDSSIVPIPPVVPRDIYLLPYSHNDIGYTDVQPVVEKRHWKNIDDAVRLIRETKNFPDGARFKWNVEVLWAFDSYLRQASDSQREQLLTAIRDGSVGLNAFYGNMQTGIMSSAELKESIAFAKEFSERYGIPIRTALQSDVPGFVWGVVPTLAQQGIRYFASSPNPFDRIGYVLTTWGDHPFYWMSQSGRDSVLFWVAGLSYASFHEGSLPRLGEDKIVGILRKLDSYPYKIVNLPYTLGDNAGVDTALSEYVKEWNNRYESPRLMIATYQDLFTAFEREYGAVLPRHAGDFTPYWEDGTISTAFETAMNRHAADRLSQAEVLWSICAPQRFPVEEFSDAWRQVVLYDEHTWGAWNSISEPDNAGVRRQWDLKRQFALDADSLSRDLMARALESRNKASEGVFDVINTASWPRSDLVIMSAVDSRRGDKVTDARGAIVASQRLSTGELAVLVDSVPAFGAKRIFVQRGKSNFFGKAWTRATTLGNETVRIDVDDHTGTIRRLTWRAPENITREIGLDLNQYLYVSGRNPDSISVLRNVTVLTKETGGLVATLLVKADAPGCSTYESEVRVVSGVPWIEVTNRLTKKPVRTKEGVHIAFPFSIPGGQIRYDVADGIVRPEADQLAGANKNFFSIQRWVDIANKEYGITLALPDAPLVEFGRITAEQPWRTTVHGGTTVVSYVMNNYWHTNFKADQEGDMDVRYRILMHGAYDGTRATMLGREAREPLIVAKAESGSPMIQPFLTLKAARTVSQSVQPSKDGEGWFLTLYNPSASPDEVHISWNSQNGTPAAKGSPSQTERMMPFETRTIVVTR